MDKHQIQGTFPLPNHDGETYAPGLDKMRLNGQLRRVYDLMRDGEWRTLWEIQGFIGGSEAAISARLRDFRKEKFGGYEVMSRRRGAARDGLHEYRLNVAKNRETYPAGGMKMYEKVALSMAKFAITGEGRPTAFPGVTTGPAGTLVDARLKPTMVGLVQKAAR